MEGSIESAVLYVKKILPQDILGGVTMPELDICYNAYLFIDTAKRNMLFCVHSSRGEIIERCLNLFL
jgi:hypothetical protein